MMEEDGVKGQNQVQSMSKAMGSNYKQKQRAVLVTFWLFICDPDFVPDVMPACLRAVLTRILAA